MTEQEIPMSSAPYQGQNFKHVPEDEISLMDLLGALYSKKVIIFFTASIFIIFSIFYAFLVAPIYRVTITLLSPEESLVSSFPNNLMKCDKNVCKNINETVLIQKNYMLSKFVSEIQSYSNQEKVFMEGKFHERFIANNPKIDIKKRIVQEINRSIHVSQTSGGIAKVVDYDMKGVNPELASDYLNALADWVRNKVELDIPEVIQKGIKDQISLSSSRLNDLLSVEKLKHEDKIKVFTDNLEIAKNLGILDNNLDNFNTVNRYQNYNQPIWYLYGQLALEQELNLLERQVVYSKENSKEIANLTVKIQRLSSTDASKMNIEPVIISQPSIPPVYPTSMNKIKVITIGITFGLFIGILIALLSCLMTNLKERPNLLS